MKQECKDCNKSLDDCTCIEDTIDMKQETLEEAAERYAEEHKWEEQDPWFDFMEGARWQQERMFELVKEYNQMLIDSNVHEDHKEKSFKEWFEQFKKK